MKGCRIAVNDPSDPFGLQAFAQTLQNYMQLTSWAAYLVILDTTVGLLVACVVISKLNDIIRKVEWLTKQAVSAPPKTTGNWVVGKETENAPHPGNTTTVGNDDKRFGWERPDSNS
jgi:hypothetical protein